MMHLECAFTLSSLLSSIFVMLAEIGVYSDTLLGVTPDGILRDHDPERRWQC